MQNRLYNLLILSVIFLALTGCFHSPGSLEPKADLAIPEKWSSETVNDADPNVWLASFQDPLLEALVDEAIKYNYDLKAAQERLEEAALNVRIAGAELWPQISLGADASRFKRNFIGFSALSGGSGSTIVSNTVNIYEPSIDLNWEIDLWGGIRDNRQAAYAEFLSEESLFESARFSLAANVARGWFATTEAKLHLALARKTAISLENNFKVINERYRLGTVPPLDLHLARRDLATARGNVSLRERQLDNAMRSLEIVLGRYPAAELNLAEELPVLKAELPAGVPLQLLERRPDIIAAYHRVEAERRRAKVANKARLPNFTIYASYGTSSGSLADALEKSFSVWSLAGSAMQPVFQGGRLKASAKAARSRWEGAVANYKSAILSAYFEVEFALSSELHLKERIASLELAVTEAGASENLAWDRYKKGTADILIALDAQRRAFESRSAWIESQGNYLSNRIDLCLALGGSFREETTDE